MGETEQGRLALLSVFNKEGLEDFARALVAMGWDLLASGGTAAKIREAGLPVTDVAEWVGGGATGGHLVVTLSRQVATALLSSDDAEIAANGARRIDLVRCDMYPIKNAIAAANATSESVRDKTDIGGPTMIREAVKGGRIAIVDAADCPTVIKKLQDGTFDDDYRRHLAAKAEYIVADYVMASAKWLGHGRYDSLNGELARELAYGENAYQVPARLYGVESTDPLAISQFSQIGGSPATYNFIAEIDRQVQTFTHAAAALHLLGPLPEMVLGTKHGNACGFGAKPNAAEAFQAMIVGDPLAIFGGIVMTNKIITEELAEILLTYQVPAGEIRILDGVIAPGMTDSAVEILSKRAKCRLMVNPALAKPTLDTSPIIRPVRGGFLTQPNYNFVLDFNDPDMKVWGEMGSQQELDMALAWAIAATSVSNTITLVKNGTLIGNACGQQDRVGAGELAVWRARRSGHEILGATAASDSFFPFTDGPEVLVKAGVLAIFATHGSRSDQAVIDYICSHNVALRMLHDKKARAFFRH